MLTKCLTEQQQVAPTNGREVSLTIRGVNRLDKQLMNAYERFAASLRSSVEDNWKSGFPRYEPFGDREQRQRIVQNDREEPTSLAVWDQLFLFAKCVARCTIDRFCGGTDVFSDEAREIIEKKRPAKPEPDKEEDMYEELKVEIGKDLAAYFQTVYSMRNRDAHTDDPGQRPDWNQIQNLRNSYWDGGGSQTKELKLPNRLFQPDDLQLTSLEGTEIKLPYFARYL